MALASLQPITTRANTVQCSPVTIQTRLTLSHGLLGFQACILCLSPVATTPQKHTKKTTNRVWSRNIDILQIKWNLPTLLHSVFSFFQWRFESSTTIWSEIIQDSNLNLWPLQKASILPSPHSGQMTLQATFLLYSNNSILFCICPI